ncbi:MAG: hypothetical protein NTY68_03355, partial [Candidatus Micrarchaeota archaeon]|nr:hypothetical protein [Candidatus Micrarchaeota archaeon]
GLGMENNDSDDERAFLILNKIVEIVKEYSPIEKISKINVDFPDGYPVEKLKAYFSNMGIKLSPKVSEKGIFRIRDIELK